MFLHWDSSIVPRSSLPVWSPLFACQQHGGCGIIAAAAEVPYRLARLSRRSPVDGLPFSAIAGCDRACLGGWPALAGKPLAFNRDIRPILSDKCFRCHGPDAAHRKAGLRLDRRDDALARDAASRPSCPANRPHSELYRRITADDPSERMPPTDSGQTLGRAKSRLLRQWIASGSRVPAALVVHPAEAAEPPAIRKTAGFATPIDVHPGATWKLRGLHPSPEADRPSAAAGA